MDLDSDDILFKDDENDELEVFSKKKEWKVMIIDDEQDIHILTKNVLRDIVYLGKKLSFISAFSASEAKKVFQKNQDVAIIFLDVVMETNDSGLKFVKFVRDEIGNKVVRIILRTGQPGYAPEEKVILDYDINDYKEKTELTSRKLFTTVISALRAYNDIMIIEMNKSGLEKIIDATATIFKPQSMEKFASGVLTQITSILNLKSNALFCQQANYENNKDNSKFSIVAGSGIYYEKINENITDILTDDILNKINKSLSSRKSLYFDEQIVNFFESESGSKNIIYFETWRKLNIWEKDLIRLFCTNVSIAFDNIYLHKEIVDTQKEIILTLSDIVEARSSETGDHVTRVSKISEIIGKEYGLTQTDIDTLVSASPMHDLGKLGIPDAILNKPSKLTEGEFEIIKRHANIGFEMLKNSKRKIMKAAATIALQHQEKYDGTGYPSGLKGEEIHIFARITAIADVYDALVNDRVYRKALPLNEVLDYIKNQKGKHFDPKIVDIFFNNIDKILKI